MPRPDRSDDRRKQLLPVVCRAFGELGYQRATTAELARRCGVRENVLYRLWPDKKTMFLAAIDDVFTRRAEQWRELLTRSSDGGAALEKLVKFEARHQGEFGFYRVIFTALAEADDPEIRAALVDTYRRFHDLVLRLLERGRPAGKARSGLPADDAAWALLGLATISNIIRRLGLTNENKRSALFARVAGLLVTGKA
jgi:AcrR family transcriptional regulator